MSSPAQNDDLPLVFELGATTWRVLVALLAVKRPIGARDVARRLGMSSHTVAIYHLEKLQSYNIIERNMDGKYLVRSDADLGFLDNFLYVKHKIIPRILFYAVVVTGLVVFYSLFVGFDYSVHGVFALTIGIISMVFFWAEVYRIWSGLV
jgi:predicted transcriptional regulator